MVDYVANEKIKRILVFFRFCHDLSKGRMHNLLFLNDGMIEITKPAARIKKSKITLISKT